LLSSAKLHEKSHFGLKLLLNSKRLMCSVMREKSVVLSQILMEHS